MLNNMDELKLISPRNLLDYDSTNENTSLVVINTLDNAEDIYNAPDFLAHHKFLNDLYGDSFAHIISVGLKG